LIRKFFSYIIHYYVPLSTDLKRYLHQVIKIKSDKIITICNGVDTEKFKPLEQTRLTITKLSLTQLDWINHFINKKTFVIGTVGRLEKVKDQTNLLDAFIELLKSPLLMNKDVKLLLVGEGSLRQSLEATILAAQVQDKVCLIGACDAIPELMNIMDIFVLPSLAEGISNTILEAMACALPVIATNVGGNIELVNDGQTGFLVPKADPQAIKEKCLVYIKEPQLIAEQGHLARTIITETLSLTKMVQHYDGLYLTSLKEKIA
jgi:sugar transferase (PEP-CTERM/EpsH1 system associated)